jgi:predicted MFS family arabinose efflux permease
MAVPVAAALAAIAATLARDRSINNEGQECDPLGLWREIGVKRWVLAELLVFMAWGGALVYAGAVYIEVYGFDVEMTGVVLGVGAALYLPGNFLARRLTVRHGGLVLVGFTIAAAAAVVAYGSGWSMRPRRSYSLPLRPSLQEVVLSLQEVVLSPGQPWGLSCPKGVVSSP